jgi:hypothetical protein
MKPELQEFIKNLREQDNYITDSPIFYCQVKNRIENVHEVDSTGYVWKDGDWYDVEDEELIQKLDECEERNAFPKELANHTKIYYKEQWLNKQPFFTEAAAEEYIRVNGHNLNEPRIYVDSAWRNSEWQFVREYFLSLDLK